MLAPTYAFIVDEFVEKTLSDELTIKLPKQPTIIDEFAQKSIDKDLQINPNEAKIIDDNFAENNKNKNIVVVKKITIDEKLPCVKEKSANFKKTLVVDNENSQPVKIRIKKDFSTNQEIEEGDYIEFETISDVKIQNKTYPAHTTVKARVETISPNKMWGVPADLTVGNFTLDNHSLNGEINKTGANRSLWLYPTVYFTSFFFGAGLLLIPIHGGEAKIKNLDIYTIYYAN